MTLSFEDHIKEVYFKRYIELSPHGKAISAVVNVAGVVAAAAIIIEIINQLNEL